MRLLTLLLSLLLQTPICAQQSRGSGQVVSIKPSKPTGAFYASSWAVVIGIDQYEKWQPLQYAVKDAWAVREKLLTLDFPESNIFVLTDGQASKKNIEHLLGEELPARMGVEDRAFVYFAGHGQTETLASGGEEGYLVPVDGDRKNWYSTCISMRKISELSDRMRAKHVFYAIDACYSGLAFMRGERNFDPDEQNYLEKVSGYRARQLVTAGRADESVLEVGGHGVFTRYLLMGLSGEADKTRPFNVITGDELGIYLAGEVALATRNAQTPQYGRLQGEGQFLFLMDGFELAASDTALAAPKPIVFGHLQVNVTVPSSLVYVNGTYRGMASPESPLELQNAGAGEVEVRVVADGYQDLSKKLELKPEGWTQGIFDLPGISARDIPDRGSGMRLIDDMAAVADFNMDRFEVTNTQYAAFLNEKENKRVQGETWMKMEPDAGIETINGRYVVRPTHENHPVVRVTWFGANAYCEWAGKRLPTDKEWLRACQGQTGRAFAWGSKFDESAVNIDGPDIYPRTSPVGHFKAGLSEEGVADLSGNVWEWTNTRTFGGKRVVRGGSFLGNAGAARCTSRESLGPTEQGIDVGFRCVK
jgi:hypothetical protein